MPTIASRAVGIAAAETQAGMFGADDATARAAIGASAAVLEAAEQHLAATVDHQRRMGATWQEVGDALGVSRQGAQRRFGKTVGNGTEEGE